MKRWLFIGILILGLAEFSYGIWIPAKAWLSRQLLDYAWQESIEQRKPVKPWPWADTRPVLRLTHTASNHAVLVLQGDSGQALAFGPGLSSLSTPPGVPGNTIISAHRDTHFSFLADLQRGQELLLQDQRGDHFTYRISSMDVVDSRSNRIMTDVSEDLLTLVTCYPFDQFVAGGPLRYLVTAVRVAPV